MSGAFKVSFCFVLLRFVLCFVVASPRGFASSSRVLRMGVGGQMSFVCCVTT